MARQLPKKIGRWELIEARAKVFNGDMISSWGFRGKDKELKAFVTVRNPQDGFILVDYVSESVGTTLAVRDTESEAITAAAVFMRKNKSKIVLDSLT